MNDNFELISNALKENGITADEGKITLLSDYLTELLRVNQFMNLTAVRDPREAAVKNIADCAVCAKFIPENARLLDVGSGGGLPAFPFAIMRPDVSVTALDSTGKKVNFISETAALLRLDNLTAICSRAEELASDKKLRESFDAVSARAVARLNILSELCLPFVKKGGVFIAMKSRLAAEELAEARRGITILGGDEPSVSEFSLKGLDEDQDRTVILTKKISGTPKEYPREYRRISAKPL